MSSHITRALVVLTLAASAYGQTLAPRPPATPPPTQPSTPPPTKPARFILSAVGEDGAVLPDLAQQDLVVRIGEKPVAISGLSRFHQAPIRIVVVLDESSSMQGRWRVALGIVFELLKTLPPNSTVGLVGVNDQAPEMIESPDAILRYLKNRAKRGPGGWTRLWDDIHMALLFFPQPRSSDVIFVVSDGVDNASKLTYQRLREEVRAAKVRVSGALLTDQYSPDPEARTVTGKVAALIDETGGWNLTSPPFVHERAGVGGRMEEAPTQAPNLAGFFHTLYDFYLVELGPEGKVTRPEPLNVRIADGRKDRAQIFVSAPHGLLPAAP
ncbi:MAG: VWA domain-containing protein [Acidobacteriota bacterium]|nr:VWA domain-containing protein [Acidobacteriota bacterium]